ncbi:MAG: 4Fe-4S binding protein [Candidatus Competibacter sp.]
MSLAPTAEPLRERAAPPPAGMARASSGRLGLAATLPLIAGERCVHARIETASCRACAEACPRGAWIIDSERVGIDIDTCDGCDLCVPACPEGAISSARGHAADLVIWNGRPTVFRACENAGATGESGIIPCLHAIGAMELLRLYRRGATSWIACAAPCDTCPRGGTQRLEESVRQANALLASRGLRPLALTVLEPDRWSATRRQAKPRAAEAALTRRRFFRGAWRAAVNAVLDTAAGTADADASGTEFIPATAWLPRAGPDDVCLHRPAIDPERCNGCDACARLCPHQAIALERSADGLRYRLDGRQCTGCGLCRDVCDRDAIAIDSMRTQRQTTVPLAESRCPVCGVAHHAPEPALSADGRCRICARTPHARLLHQVLG